MLTLTTQQMRDVLEICSRGEEKDSEQGRVTFICREFYELNNCKESIKEWYCCFSNHPEKGFYGPIGETQ